MSPRRTEIDFDQHSTAYGENPWSSARTVAEKCPVAWTENHGGFWVISGYEHVTRIARDTEAFSSRHDLPNGSTPYQGINLPSAPSRFIPDEMDPPEQTRWRRALARSFSPGAVNAIKPLMREFTTWLLNERIETGTIDLVTDLAIPVPAMVTMHLLGMPVTEWREFADITHRINYTVGEDREPTFLAFERILAELVPEAMKRREKPADDLLTCLATMEPAGRPLTGDEIQSACGVIVAGGIDTTGAVVAGALQYLDGDPGLRQRLIDDPALMPKAVEEFLRYVTPVQSLARTASRDVEVNGEQIREGDRLLLLWAGGDMDPVVFEDPETVNIDRETNRHLAFGSGPHRCIGAEVARADIANVLSQVLERMPDYELTGAAERYPSVGVVHGYKSMPARFTPGQRVGVSTEVQHSLDAGRLAHPS